MAGKNPRSSPPLSQLFYETVINVKSESRNQQQVNSKSASDIDRPSSQPNCQLPQDDNRLPTPQSGHHASVDVSSNLSGISAQSLSASCGSSESSSISSTEQPHQHYPVPHEYYRILMEDATDRYAEASKFFHKARSYSLMFEFHIKILNDLFEELANIPSNVEAEAYQSASTLRQRMCLLQLHLVGRRNLLLSYTRDHWRNEKIIPPAGAEIFLEAAAEAKAARQRQCQMVALVQTITDLKMKEDMCKQQRLEAEAELIQYFDQLKLSSDGDGRQKYKRPETANETVPPGNDLFVRLFNSNIK